jgi:small-conductance mechanosensitive channel
MSLYLPSTETYLVASVTCMAFRFVSDRTLLYTDLHLLLDISSCYWVENVCWWVCKVLACLPASPFSFADILAGTLNRTAVAIFLLSQKVVL